MKKKCTFMFLMAIGTVLVLGGVWQKAHAGGNVVVHKTRDAHLKVWNTFMGWRVGDPIVDIDVPGCTRTSVPLSWWATDASIEQKFIAPPALTTTHSLAAIVPDPLNPGLYTMERMLPWLQSNYGSSPQELPDLASSFFDVYVAVDIGEWLGSGMPMPPPDDGIPVSGGLSPLLPGYHFGTEPILFDPRVGWLNPVPYDGDVTVAGDIVLTGGYAGDNCFDVSCGRSYHEFNVNPIPADFFGPGSDPFDGIVELQDANSVGPDTVVRRLADFNLPGPGSTDMVPIELVALSLKSCEPIIVTTPGSPDELWDVEVELSPTPAPVGQMTITKTHANGGTFTSDFYVQPMFTFTKVDDPAEVRVLDTGLEGIPAVELTNPEPYPWQNTSPKANPPCDGNDFYPVGPQPLIMQSPITVTLLELHPPEPVSPYIALDSEQQWQEALTSGRVTDVCEPDWLRYMESWRTPQEGEQYPANIFLPPELSVWPGDCICPGLASPPDDVLPSAGLLMAWGDPLLLVEGESYSSAWMYQYPADPDLTNVTITITVFPPCGMNVVSFGMKDINGNIRGWFWNVAAAPGPGTLQCGIGTTININTALTGVGAAAPVAASYTSAAGFNITQVIELIFDENNVWVADANVPPPGTTVARPWNYWRDLIITPNPAPGKPDDPRKWSQPPVEVAPQVYLGWDEESVRDKPPLMADDWKCEDPRPVTDVHWWGSYLDWMEEHEPPVRPTAFHFGIWTDVPAGADPDPNVKYSHPGKMVWEHICNNYLWIFVGYDKDPRNSAAPVVRDSCFQFWCDLPASDWFYQKPNPNGHGRVYWLSIAAIYDSNQPDPNYPWGWKTRPHFDIDDAVRILTLADGSWPPSVGSDWGGGEPVEYPEKISWDLAFELTTNEDEPELPNPDLNLDGIFNFKDLLFDRWLEIWP